MSAAGSRPARSGSAPSSRSSISTCKSLRDGRAARPRPRTRHLRSALQRELSRQHPAGVEHRSRTDGAALRVLVRAKRVQRSLVRPRRPDVGGQPVSAEQDRGQLHQQRHQLAGVSRRQPAGLGTGLSVARPRRSRPRQAARRHAVSGGSVQRRSQRRQRLKSAGAASDRDGVQLSAAALFSSPRRATFPIRARTPAGFPAPTASARGITPARVSPISASTIPASRWQIRNRPAFRSSMPAMAASMA